MEKHNYYLYCHTNKINGKKYIGISLQKPSHRWQNGRGYKDCPKFNKAIQKYGWDNFEHEILLEHLTQQEASQYEKEYISKYNTIDNGYNILQGGLDNSANGGTIYFNKKPINQYGLDRQLIKTWDSAMQIERELGYGHSSITACCRRESITSYNYIWRYKDDCDDVNDIIVKPINCYHSCYNNNELKINQYDLNGNLVKQWNNIVEISKAFNKPTTLFTNCCNRKPKCKTAYGYQWRYANDCDDITVFKNNVYKAIYELDNNNNIIHEFKSMTDAQKFYNDDKLLVCAVCSGFQKSTKGHIFCYKENYNKDISHIDTISNHCHKIYVLDLNYNIIEQLDSIKDFNKKYLHKQRCGYSYEIINNKLYHRIVNQQYHICDINDYSYVIKNYKNNST